jgi:hypothetical protein
MAPLRRSTDRSAKVTNPRLFEDEDDYEFATANHEPQTANGEPITSPGLPADNRIRERSRYTLRSRQVYL